MYSISTEKIHQLSQTLGYTFKNPGFLRIALLHPSAAPKQRPSAYERMEFLGDRILGLIIADLLFHHFPADDEGALARRHASLVRRETVASVALKIGLDKYVVAARNDHNLVRKNPTILADACEALIAALYLDGGLSAAQQLVNRCWEPMLDITSAPPKDAKTTVQEWAQARGKPPPVYKVLSISGPPHSPIFLIEADLDGLAQATAQGESKRVAEQSAAQQLLDQIRKGFQRA